MAVCGGDCPDLCGGGRLRSSVRESCRLAADALRERQRWWLFVGSGMLRMRECEETHRIPITTDGQDV
ncbi:hypothetical protein ACFX13_017431 [Malus domestica]